MVKLYDVEIKNGILTCPYLTNNLRCYTDNIEIKCCFYCKHLKNCLSKFKNGCDIVNCSEEGDGEDNMLGCNNLFDYIMTHKIKIKTRKESFVFR